MDEDIKYLQFKNMIDGLLEGKHDESEVLTVTVIYQGHK